MPSIINLTPTWEESPPDGTPCKACKEPIFSTMYVLTISGRETETKLCEPCYNLMQNERD